MGRADLIGPGKHHLVPPWQPAGTGGGGGEGMRTGKKHGYQTFTTKGVPVRSSTGEKHGFGTNVPRSAPASTPRSPLHQGWAKGGHGFADGGNRPTGSRPGGSKPHKKR
jgi:Domain of unknown function (DUF3362)